MRKTVATLLTAFAGGLFSLGVYHFVTPEKNVYPVVQQTSPPVYHTSYDPAVSSNIDFTVAAERTVNAVVHIKTTMKVPASRYVDPLEQFFFGSPYGNRNTPQVGAGSGVILTQDGYIITNNHVVENSSDIEVTLNNKRTYKGKVVGKDPNTDLAVIKIEEQGLPVIPLANSDQVKVGEWVLAVGNPFNLTSTVTAGIVSAKGRNIDIIQGNYKIESFIQTDAVVNPGNSGGALVNMNGELVGLNTAIQTHTGSYEGYAFAIPSNLVKKVATDIIEFGSVQRGLLGVNIRDIDYDFARQKGIDHLQGVWVEQPIAGGAAQEAGIRSGDIITSINDVPVNSVAALQENVGLHRPGDKIKVTVNRSGDTKDILVTLKNKSGNLDMETAQDVSRQLGAKFEEIAEADLRKIGIRNGVRVKELVNGKLRMAGIRPGYIITEVNGHNITSVSDLNEALADNENGLYIGGVYPSGERVFYSFN